MSQDVKQIRIQQKVDSQANWEQNNPVLFNKEIGYERETGRYKIGDGIHNWNDLPFAEFGGGLGQKTKEGGEIFNDYEGNKAVSMYSSSFGSENISGLKAYYIKSIDMVNKKIYLSNTFVECPTVSEDDFTDATFETPEYAIGDSIDMIIKGMPATRSHYHSIANIVNISNNVIEYDVELPFTNVYTDNVQYSQTFYVVSKPNIGIIDIGGCSMTEGANNIAAGKWSHAEGWGNIAAGRFAHVEGCKTKAVYNAHAEGYNTKASEEYSHAEGWLTETKGRGSHSEGYKTKADGEYSHAEGRETVAVGLHSHAEGRETVAVGLHSHSEGYKTQAQGNYSHAQGKDSRAEGESSHAEGSTTHAQGECSHAEGLESHAEGIRSHVEGYKTHAKGGNSHTEGRETVAVGLHSHAEGFYAHTEGEASHAEGYNSYAQGKNAHAEGSTTHAEGTNTHAEGSYSHAEGVNSHAEGQETHAKGKYSHTEGHSVIVNSDFSHGEGYQNTAHETAIYSHVEGRGNTVYSIGAHVEGTFSLNDTAKKYKHILGGGTSDTDRKNLHTIDNNGNGWFAGNIAVGADNKKLATEEYVNNIISNNAIIMVDRSTKVKYEIYIDNGKLTMSEVSE